MTDVRPTGGVGNDERRSFLGFRYRSLDLIHDGRTFLRRRGIEHDRLGGVMIHRLDAADPGLDVHDHPWPFLTIVLCGGYTEQAIDCRQAAEDAIGWVHYDLAAMTTRFAEAGELAETRTWRRWSAHLMPLNIAHRITVVEPGTVTLVLRRPKARDWGFYPPGLSGDGLGAGVGTWVPWTQYDYAARRPVNVDSSHPEEIR